MGLVTQKTNRRARNGVEMDGVAEAKMALILLVRGLL